MVGSIFHIFFIFLVNYRDYYRVPKAGIQAPEVRVWRAWGVGSGFGDVECLGVQCLGIRNIQLSRTFSGG